jgi:hypothetical protein
MMRELMAVRDSKTKLKLRAEKKMTKRKTKKPSTSDDIEET